jgi:hypothetical protein
MGESARRHSLARGTSAAAQLLAVALVAIIAGSPIASSWHELTVRHERCAEHGELTHVPTSRGLAGTEARTFASVGGVDLAALDGHDHCAGGCIVRKKIDVSVIRTPVRWAPPPSIARETRDLAPRPGRACVLASAPKTSPPSA